LLVHVTIAGSLLKMAHLVATVLLIVVQAVNNNLLISKNKAANAALFLLHNSVEIRHLNIPHIITPEARPVVLTLSFTQ
jgi:hypothetical protein